ncbi:hypothetical protein AB0I34_00820 [Kribbella sp. NPDC050281]|uniref:three-helix bundle dimerization domain-containing protein n=1 Tax=Kribbella sp. NPDC050281 TaxID=3155515 RepID=UPI0033E2D675
MTETIERFLHSSYDQFATGSTIPNFLPLLAERFARQRLTALARVEGHHDDGKPVVLFLCVHNAKYPKPWTDEVVRAADVVVTMGCGDACPIFPGTRYENWELDDPNGLDVADVRPIRDEIERRVLFDELAVPVSRG